MSDDVSITTIDLLRHGECTDGHYYRGSTDVALSDEGMSTMSQRVTQFLGTREPCWEHIISSPLIRCSAFAKTLSQEYGLPVELDDRLKEMHFGDWDGQSIDYIWQTQQQCVEQWFEDPVKFPPPNGEPADVFAERVVNGFSDLLKKYQGQHILLLTHGGVMRVLLSHCLSMSLQDLNRFDIPYGCLSRLQVVSSGNAEGDIRQDHYRLVAHNMANTLK